MIKLNNMINQAIRFGISVYIIVMSPRISGAAVVL